MSGPFSNAHLRVPRGFGSVLEGLAREVLRDQPEDIPAYAARYFDSLLKQREESGVDPAEWAAKLEDRFNNDAFQNTGTSPDKETASDVTFSIEKSKESQTEDESSHSSEASCLSTQPHVSEKLDSTESTDEEEMNTTKKLTISAEEGCSEMKSVADRQSDDKNGGDKAEDPTETTLEEAGKADMEIDENRDPDENIPLFGSEPSISLSFKDISNVEVTTHELGLPDDGGVLQESETVDKETVDLNREENTENNEAVESFPLSGLVDVDVCATELGEAQKTTEEGTVQENTDVEEDKEENAELSQSKQDFTQDSQQDDNDQAQKDNKKERTEAKASYGETNEALAPSKNDLDDSVMPKDSSVEISFEDVPEAQGIPEVEGENLVQDASVEILQNNKFEMQQKEESIELTATSAYPNMSDSKDQLKFKTEKDTEESTSEEEEIHAAFDISEEKVDANNSNLNDSDGKIEASVKGQPITEAEDDIQEHETDHEDTEEIFERIFSQNQEPKKKQQSKDFEQAEMADTSEDEEGYREMGSHQVIDGRVEEHSSHATKSNTSISGKEAEVETFDEDLPLANKQSSRTGQSQPDDTSDVKEITSEEEEERMKKMTDPEVHQKSKETDKEETFNLARGAEWTAADLDEEDRPDESEENTTASVNKVDEEECSRPQEEEDIMDIPLDDPEANRAAAKIQAGFRGHMTRKKMKPEDKTEGEEVSSTGDVLNSSQGVSETGRSGAVGRDDTSVPEQ